MDRIRSFILKAGRFLKGRNGMDTLAKDLYLCSVILLLLSSLFHSGFLRLISSICLGYSLFRCFSRSINVRQIENRKYIVLRNKMINRFRYLKRKWEDRKMYRYYTCKNCGQKVRVPSGKGAIEITCPKCGNRFDKRT